MQLVGITSLLIYQLSGKKSFIACWIKNRHKHTGTITTTEGGRDTLPVGQHHTPKLFLLCRFFK